jgi:hypothetical protein
MYAYTEEDIFKIHYAVANGRKKATLHHVTPMENGEPTTAALYVFFDNMINEQ